MGSTIADAAYMETKELRAIQNGFDRLISELLPAVEAGDFGMVIGDDTTGRIPARFIHSFINYWNASHNVPPVPLVFIQGTSSSDQMPQLRHALDQRAHLLARRHPDKKALVVTEGVTSGGCIARLGSELTARGIPFDVAVLDGKHFTRTPTDNNAVASRAQVDAFAALLKSAQHPVSPRYDELISFWNSHVDAVVSSDDELRFEEAFANGTLSFQFLQNIKPIAKRSTGTPNGTIMAQRLVLAANSQRFPRDVIDSFIHSLETYDIPEQVFQSMRREWFSVMTTDRLLMEKGIWAVTTRGIRRGTSVPVSTIDAVGWPTATRLFRGKMNAGPIRDRPALSGLVLEKFSKRPLHKSTKEERARLRQVRQDLRSYAKWSCERLGFDDDVILMLLPHLSSVLQQLIPDMQQDAYAFILGQNPGGRLPAKLIGKAINAWRVSMGKEPLPIVFLDGNKIPHPPDQVAAAERLARYLPGSTEGKRALVIADPAEADSSLPSIVERMHDIGYASDLVYLLGMSVDSIRRYLDEGQFRPETRVFSSVQSIDYRTYQGGKPATTGVHTSKAGTVPDRSALTAVAATALHKNITHGAQLLAREIT